MGMVYQQLDRNSGSLFAIWSANSGAKWAEAQEIHRTVALHVPVLSCVLVS